MRFADRILLTVPRRSFLLLSSTCDVIRPLFLVGSVDLPPVACSLTSVVVLVGAAGSLLFQFEIINGLHKYIRVQAELK